MFRNRIRFFNKLSQDCFSTSRFQMLAQLHIRQLHINESNAYKGAVVNHRENVINTEIQHLEKFGSDWWDPKGSLRALHSMNMIRVPFIRDGLIATNKVSPNLIDSDHVLGGLNILEVGCGGGILTEQLGRLHANVTGIDLSDKLIQVARNHLENESNDLLKQVQYKIEPIDVHARYNQDVYDAVIVSEVIEHVDEKANFLTACTNTLKPGGSIFITTFNKTFLSLLGGVLAAEYILCIVPEGTHDWNKFIPPIEGQRILESANCSVVLVNGFFYEFWKNQWKWIPSTTFSYAMQAIKIES